MSVLVVLFCFVCVFVGWMFCLFVCFLVRRFVYLLDVLFVC